MPPTTAQKIHPILGKPEVVKFFILKTVNIAKVVVFTVFYLKGKNMSENYSYEVDEINKYKIYMCSKCIFYKNKQCTQKINVIKCAKYNLKSK